MKIISWNLLHRSGATLDQVKRLIARHRPDLLLMQEATDSIDSLPVEFGGHYVRNVLPGRAHGLAAWSPGRLRHAPSTLTLQSGVIVKRICQIIELEDFAVVNVHLSHGQLLNRRQLRRIFRILPARAAILGDCNLLGPSLLPGFHDVGPRQPTHAAGAILPVRLDRCFVRGLRCDSAEALSRGTSDHRPIVVQLFVPVSSSGPGVRP
jgi:endonuclease/exonuclease/phosphatase (EEP) superfamily protein YafD